MYRKKGQADKVFTFTHLADAFIQNNLQCIQVILFFHQYVCSLGIEPTTFCTANAMLYHWALRSFFIFNYKQLIKQTAVSWDPDNSIDYNIS